MKKKKQKGKNSRQIVLLFNSRVAFIRHIVCRNLVGRMRLSYLKRCVFFFCFLISFLCILLACLLACLLSLFIFVFPFSLGDAKKYGVHQLTMLDQKLLINHNQIRTNYRNALSHKWPLWNSKMHQDSFSVCFEHTILA